MKAKDILAKIKVAIEEGDDVTLHEYASDDRVSVRNAAQNGLSVLAKIDEEEAKDEDGNDEDVRESLKKTKAEQEEDEDSLPKDPKGWVPMTPEQAKVAGAEGNLMGYHPGKGIGKLIN